MIPRHLISRSLHRQRHPAFRIPPASSQFHRSSARNSGNEPPQSPFQAFVTTLRAELQKSRELQDSIKQVQGDVESFASSESMKRAREVYERARLVSSVRENERLRRMAEEVRRVGGNVGDAVGEAVRGMEESEGWRAVSVLLIFLRSIPSLVRSGDLICALLCLL